MTAGRLLAAGILALTAGTLCAAEKYPKSFRNNTDGIVRNPLVRHVRTADPSAHVWKDGRLYIYTSHDQDYATNYNNMDGYHVFSTADMKTWIDHGEILRARDVDWGWPPDGLMYAPSAACKDGTYYLFFPHMGKGVWKWCIGVATSTNPAGPFKDRGYIKGAHEIDPCCFIDDDGKAYLYWGGGENGPFAAPLKDDMMELAADPVKLDYGSDGFGEGAYMHRYKGNYYFSYTCFKCGDFQGHYSMGDSPLGPFKDMGTLCHNPPGAQDHHSMVEFKGQWYYFYHLGNYRKGSMFRRNVCVDPMYYNDDGSIRQIVQTIDGKVVFPHIFKVRPPIDRETVWKLPARIEAENWCRATNARIEHTTDDGGGDNIGWIDDGEWCVYRIGVPKTRTWRLSARVATDANGGTIEVFVDGLKAGTIGVDKDLSDGWQDWYTTRPAAVPLSSGNHEVKLVFRGSGPGLFNINWFQLK